jgi:hypothetical protein
VPTSDRTISWSSCRRPTESGQGTETPQAGWALNFPSWHGLGITVAPPAAASDSVSASLPVTVRTVLSAFVLSNGFWTRRCISGITFRATHTQWDVRRRRSLASAVRWLALVRNPLSLHALRWKPSACSCTRRCRFPPSRIGLASTKRPIPPSFLAASKDARQAAFAVGSMSRCSRIQRSWPHHARVGGLMWPSSLHDCWSSARAAATKHMALRSTTYGCFLASRDSCCVGCFLGNCFSLPVRGCWGTEKLSTVRRQITLRSAERPSCCARFGVPRNTISARDR